MASHTGINSVFFNSAIKIRVNNSAYLFAIRFIVLRLFISVFSDAVALYDAKTKRN